MSNKKLFSFLQGQSNCVILHHGFCKCCGHSHVIIADNGFPLCLKHVAYGFLNGHTNLRGETYGESTEVKDTATANHMDLWYEMDTGKVFMYSEVSGQWLEQ